MRSSSQPKRASSPTQVAGQQAEDVALALLQQQGHQLIARNFYCRFGEIDLITLQHDWLVFTEVRWRRHHDFGGAAASITPAKQRRIVATARYFLCREPQRQHYLIRFDVMLFQGIPPQWQHQWIQAAFGAD